MPYLQPSGGWIELICGSMFSGKTEELIRRVRRAVIARQRVQVFKPEIDVRYLPQSGPSHDGDALAAIPVARSGDIPARVDPETTVVAIDEAQFFDLGIEAVVDRLAD